MSVNELNRVDYLKFNMCGKKINLTKVRLACVSKRRLARYNHHFG